MAHIHTNPDAKKFLNEVLSPPEKIMLAKRFAIVVMIYRKQSYTTIEKVLKVSPVTIAKIRQRMVKGEFNFITSQLPKRKASGIKKEKSIKNNLWLTLDIMLGMGSTSMGKNRWKFLNEIEEKKRKNKKKKIR
ncbi:MAG: Trp family transcriptional regulator [Candidatus Paceibacteria bacterium]